MFNPSEHLIDIKGKKYLPVAARLVWFREEHPDWAIHTSVVERGDGWALMKASISSENGYTLATAHKAETKAGFGDYLEKAETGAVGRALAMCGYGTQFAPEFAEGEERIVDTPQVVAPGNPPAAKPSHLATEPQRKYIFKLGMIGGMSPDETKEMAKKKFGLVSFTELTKDQASDMIELQKLSMEEAVESVKPDEVPF